jgi:murein DD-endopeptidase MepM/ murein hydrolase activator NlpD
MDDPSENLKEESKGDRQPALPKRSRLRLWLAITGFLVVMAIAGPFMIRELSKSIQLDRRTKAQESTQVSLEQEMEAGANDVPLSAIDLAGMNYLNGIPRRAMLRTAFPNRPRVDVTTYEVQPGDNLFAIAEKYNLKPETILWGNFEVLRDNPQYLSPGQEINILPVDGVYYQWEAGDTLEGVAAFFKVDPEAILDYLGNRFDLAAIVEGNVPIEEGTWLIIPGGQRVLKDWGPPAITRNNPAAAAYYGSGYCGDIYEGAIGIGSFVWPTVARTLSGNDYSALHRGIDIAGAEGNSVYAVDSGVVVFSGWSEFGYGNMIVIDHGTGWQSAYAHLSAAAVTCGQNVAQSSYIGAVGNTGRSTGPHLHFELQSEIYGKVNPWDFLIP